MMVFDEYAAYYDLLYRDKDYVGEAEYIDRLLRSTVGGDGLSVVELGCGTGKHAYLLAQHGHTVYGVERSREMLRQAKSRAKDIKELSFVESDIRNFYLGQSFDAAIALFHVMSYQIKTEDFIQVLRNVWSHLREDGVFVFDTWYGPAVLTEHPEVRVRRLEDERYRITRIAEPVVRFNENVVDVHYDVFVENKQNLMVKNINELHSMRYYFLPEIRSMLDSCGFCIEKACEFMTEHELGEGTWGSMFVARKRT